MARIVLVCIVAVALSALMLWSDPSSAPSFRGEEAAALSPSPRLGRGVDEIDTEAPIVAQPLDPEDSVPSAAPCFGRVVDERGRPIPGAKLSLHRDPTPGLDHLSETPALETRTSGADGRFEMEEIARSECYWIRASHPEFSLRIVRGLKGADPSSLHPEICLQVGLLREGSVRDARGAPVGQATVQVFALDGPLRFDTARLERTAKTDAAGMYRVAGLSGGYKRVTASKAGYATDCADYLRVVGPSDRPIDLTLEAGKTISGVVVDASSGDAIPHLALRARLVGRLPRSSPRQAIATGKEKPPLTAMKIERAVPTGSLRTLDPTMISATVSRDQSLQMDPVQRRARYVPTTVSDASGAFRFEGLAGATYVIAVDDPRCQQDTEWRAAAGESAVRIEVGVRPTLSGRVVDSEGHPVTSFLVAASRQKERGFVQPTERHQIRDPNGEIPNLPVAAGRYYIHIWADGFAPALSNELRVGDGGNQRVELTLSPGASLRGRILSPDGSPIANATVDLLDPLPTEDSSLLRYTARRSVGSLRAFRTQSDSTGRYLIEGLPEEAVRLRATHPQWARTLSASLLLPKLGADLVVDLSLKPAAVVSGRIRGARPGTRLLVASTEPGASPSLVSVDRDGSFRCGSLPAGAYRLIPIPRGRPDPRKLLRALMTSTPVQLTGGTRLDGLVLGDEAIIESRPPKK